MKKIVRVSYLVVCERCTLHAHIALPGGEKGKEFGTKEEGRKEVDRLLAEKQIACDEAKYLRDCIRESVLPEREHPLLEALALAKDLGDEIDTILHRHLSAERGEEKAPTLH